MNESRRTFGENLTTNKRGVATTPEGPVGASNAGRAPANLLRHLASEYEANLVTYGEEMAHGVLVSDLSEALDLIAGAPS